MKIDDIDTDMTKYRKRLHMQKKRLAVIDKLDADRDRKRRERSNSAKDYDVFTPKRISLVDLCCGCGGQLLAMLALLETAKYEDYTLHLPFACDYSSSKLSLYNSMASAYGYRHASLTDITDESYFTHTRIKSWGHVGVLMSSIPCTTFSSLGKRKGLQADATKAFVESLIRIVGLVLSPVCVFECVPQLESDNLFQGALIQPLTSLGYNTTWFSIDASKWAPTKRKRLFIVCQQDNAAFKQFRIPGGPKCREKRLYACLLRAYDPTVGSNTDNSIAKMAPLSSYAITRASKMSPSKAELAIRKMAARKKGPLSSSDLARAVGISLSDLSTAAQAVSKLPFIKRRLHSHVVTYHFDRITKIKRTYGVSPTLVKSSSGAFMLRDSFGVRVLTGREAALIHCYPMSAISAYESVASSNQIVEAIGDGFVIPVVRDVLRSCLMACLGLIKLVDDDCHNHDTL